MTKILTLISNIMYMAFMHCGNKNKEEYVNFHVDTNKFVHKEAFWRYDFGGSTSIRVKAKEL
jgi:hypothetical protein